METLIITGAELTEVAHSAYSNGRGSYDMPEGNTSPDISPKPQSPKTIGHATDQDKLVRQWHDQLSLEERTPDAERVVKALVGAGIHPDSQKTPQDSDRISQAENTLGGVKLTREQEEALIKAHLVGEGKKGKSEENASIGNYTQEQISQKARILERAGFTKEQRRILMEAGVVGMHPPSPTPKPDIERQIDDLVNDTNPGTTIKPDTFTDPELKKIAQKIEELYSSDYLSNENLVRLWEQADKRKIEGTGVPTPEAKRLEIGIKKIVAADDLRTGRSDNTRDYGAEVKQDRDYKKRIEKAESEHRADPTDVAKKAKLDELVKERKESVREIARRITPQSGGNYDRLFEIIIDEGDSLNYVVDRIIAPPLDSETGDWSLGFYGQNNLDTIISLLRNANKNVEYNHVQELEEAFRLAHTVNKSIINADLKVLEGIAGSVTDQRLNKLSRIKGVGLVTRLLEVEYQRLLARDGWINNKNFAELFGKVTNPESGLLEINQDSSAFTTFKEFVLNAKARIVANPDDPSITDEMRDLAELEEWQVLSAFNIGKSVYNMWLRGAEWISQGKVPKGDKGLVSFPQETIARILNWPQWMLQRFQISESRGGVEWLELVKKAHQASRHDEGYGETMRIAKLGGRDIANFEMPDMIGVRGWMATWREKQHLMTTMPLQFIPRGSVAGATINIERSVVNAGEITNLGFLLDMGAIEISAGGYRGPLGKASLEIQRDYWKSIFLDQAGNVRSDFKMGLGASLFFLKPSGEWEDEEHGELNKALDNVKEEIRSKIWAKTAEENPLALMSYLEGLEYVGDRDSVSIIDRAHPAEWRAFERKLFQLNEIKMQRIRGLDKALAGKDPAITPAQAAAMIGGITLAGIIAGEGRLPSGIKLDETEIGWLNRIKTEGQRAAPHLANVRFEYNPFLNDVPVEKLDYSNIGHEGFRRMLNDTGGFQGANQALIELMDNPSKYTKPEEIFEPMLKFIQGTGNILGTEAGQKKGSLWLLTTMAFYERGGNAKNALEKRIRQLPFVNEALHLMHRPNSLAQKYAGPEAANWDAQQMYEAGEQAVHMGLLTEHLHEKWKKKFGGRLGLAFTQILRFIFAGFVGSALEFAKQTPKDTELGS